MTTYPRTLRGNPFIGTHLVIDNPEDGAYGQAPTRKSCSFCFYQKYKDPDCMVMGGSPKKAFGVPLDQKMPKQIDGVEVAYYCRSWIHPDSE